MVPPWVPDVPDPAPPADAPAAAPDDGDAGGIPGTVPAPAFAPPPVPIAPSGRFTGARRNMGSFAADGDKGAMRRGVGQYFKIGYGGVRLRFVDLEGLPKLQRGSSAPSLLALGRTDRAANTAVPARPRSWAEISEQARRHRATPAQALIWCWLPGISQMG
jgi:hypothetical protein